MGARIYQVDAFADEPFKGNPAAVCILTEPGDGAWMQKVAQEMNLSETAFLCKEGTGFRLRWFTPSVEVDLCGHATLASAHILWEIGMLSRRDEARFQTRSGLLKAQQRGNEIELTFPATPDEPSSAPPGLNDALGIVPNYTGKSKFDYIVEVESEETLRNIRPDFPRLKSLPARGVIVTSVASSPGYDFVSRFFAPASGVDEDPVTGSAHCCLGPFWKKRMGKSAFIAFQASERGGVIGVRVEGDLVRLRGRAITVLRGELVGL